MIPFIRHFQRSAVLACALMVGAPESAAARTGGDERGQPLRIAVLGDSLAVSPSRDLGFPAILQEKLAEAGVASVVTNGGMRGETTAGGLRRLEALLADAPDILILALGANDGLRGIDAAAVERNLSGMIEQAQARGVRVLLCGMEAPPIRGWSYTLAFGAVFPELARRYDLPLVPFLLDGMVLNPELNGRDLIHPNARGARHIAETIWPFLQRLVLGASPTGQPQAPAEVQSAD